MDSRILQELISLLGPGNVRNAAEDLLLYEYDGSVEIARPECVVFPRTAAEVAGIVGVARRSGTPIVGRGAGTGLSGGALAREGGIVIVFSRMNRILEIDIPNQRATVQPGVVNGDLSAAVANAKLHFAPDPSSQRACTIGGNVAENSGGVHCLKYGLTTNNLLGCEIVLMSGEVVRLGGKGFDAAGYDLLGIVTGSEGLLGVVTEVTVRLLTRPQTARAMLLGFASVQAAAGCVGDIIAAGIIPAGLEMMDSPAIVAAEAFVHAGYPTEAAALLIVELDGPEAECAELSALVAGLAGARGATTIQVSTSEAQRLAFWAGRKAAFPAVGRISPDYFCMDGTIPRRQLPYVLTRITELSAAYGLGVANVFHAGDGNLHPLILYDADQPGQLEAAEAFGADILKLCVAVGGVLTGEHGVGVEKRDLMGEMFNDTDLACQQRVKCAFDPDLLLNPGKVFPRLHRCAELGRVHVHRGAVAFPELPRF
jgi:glycolate oxidase